MSTLSPEFLKGFLETYGLSTFVETGCFEGDGIAAALTAGFHDARSCDIDMKRIEHCRRRFFGQAEVVLRHGASWQVLSDLMPALNSLTLFWLDAHYPKFYDLPELETPRTRFPIQLELTQIFSMRQGAAGDVILVDDMRVINALDNPRWSPGEVSDYFRIDGLTIDELTSPFSKSHVATIDCQQEGLLVLTPNQNAEL